VRAACSFATVADRRWPRQPASPR